MDLTDFQRKLYNNRGLVKENHKLLQALLDDGEPAMGPGFKPEGDMYNEEAFLNSVDAMDPSYFYNMSLAQAVESLGLQWATGEFESRSYDELDMGARQDYWDRRMRMGDYGGPKSKEKPGLARPR